MNKDVYVLGIDPGLASLGWGVIRISSSTDNLISSTKSTMMGNCSIEHMAHGVIETKSDESLGNRLLYIEQAIDSIFLRYSVSILAYEQQFFVKNVSSGLQVAHALGVILLYSAKQRLTVNSYTPKEIKLQITGASSAKKNTVSKFVAMQLGLDEVKVHHAADALGAALCYCYRSTI